MSWFSFLTSSNNKSQKDTTILPNNMQLSSYLDREFFKYNVDKSNEMVLCFLNGHGWIWANRTFFDTMGYLDIKDFTRQNASIRDLFLHESEEVFTESEKSWLDYIAKHKTTGYSVGISDKDENRRIFKVSCDIYPKNNKIYIVTFEDVTKLHEAKLKAHEIEQLKTKFLANVGHEFRTPMNGILGFLELIKQTQLDAKQLEYIEMISQSSKNLLNNIEALLNLSQLQSGRMELYLERFNLVPMMEKLAYEFYKQGQNKGVKVLTFIDPKIPKELEGDADKIAQVMQSIIHNAVKFVPRGGRVIIEVKVLKHLPNGECSIGFGVKDNGQGISPEQIARINEPFTAGNQVDERLGVGLSLSSGLVDLMGSKLHIQSEQGHGTYAHFVLEFKDTKGKNFPKIPKKRVKVLLLDQKKVDEANFLAIYLRSFGIDVIKSNLLDKNVYDGIDALYLVANQEESSWMLELGTYRKKIPVTILLNEEEKLKTRLTHIVDKVLSRPLLPSAMAQHLQKLDDKKPQHAPMVKEHLDLEKTMNILIVEDNLINQRLIQIILQQYNVNISTASNGIEAVEMTSKHKYDLIFMDIDMPQMNGIVATKVIKAKLMGKADIPIIALTAMAMEGDKEMLLKEGLDDYLSKPFTKEKLEYILGKYLQVKV